MPTEDIAAQWDRLWPTLSGLAVLVLHAVAAGHAILTKREVRAAIGWVGVIWISPVVGPVLYGLLGINRISRRAAAIRRGRGSGLLVADAPESGLAVPPDSPEQLVQLAKLVGEVSRAPLLSGNSVEPFFTGDEAYGAMLRAIDGARASIAMSTYIFDVDSAGQRFVSALSKAQARGVQVRVLIDDAGARYSFPGARRLLRRMGVNAAHFMPALSPFRAPYVNLRNHRKLLVVDGHLGFTGGMNIRALHLNETPAGRAVRDIHFAVRGPLVAQLQRVFAEDWSFATGEGLSGPAWFPPLAPAGGTVARGIADGPDDDFEVLQWTLLGAIACARHSIRIMTPYFLPDQRLATALDVAAMRGVRVDVVVPEHGNLRVVQWAMWAELEQLVERGCHLWLSPGSFDHSKLMIVDDGWVLLGSANWDARSLRLNFEFCVECYDGRLAAVLAQHFDADRARSMRIDQALLARRTLARKLRDGVARLFSPYL